MSPLHGAWFSPPREVFEDMCIAAVAFPVLAAVAYRKPWAIALPQRSAAVESSAIASSAWERALWWADVFQRVAIVVCYIATWAYKLVMPGRLVFLLMPCHIHAGVTIYLILAERHSPFNNRVAYVALCLAWGTWLAMATPDTRDLNLPGERVHFWVYHVLLLTLPLTWVIRRRYHLYAGVWGTIATALTFDLVAIFPVQLLCLLADRNITYMMVPPKPLGAAAAVVLGHSARYRKFFGLVAAPLLVMFTRFAYAEAVVAAAGLHKQAEAEDAGWQRKLSRRPSIGNEHNGEAHADGAPVESMPSVPTGGDGGNSGRGAWGGSDGGKRGEGADSGGARRRRVARG